MSHECAWLLTAKKRNQSIFGGDRSGVLTVATYNIHACVGRDGKMNPERVAQVIRELDADVIGLQEVDSRSGTAADSQQMDYLARSTGYAAIPGPTIQFDDRSYGNVLLTRHPIYSVRKLDLSLPDREPRGAIDADLDVRGARLRVIVTHLGLRAAERRSQLACLRKGVAAKAGEVTVLMGDFNEWHPYQKALRCLRSHFDHCPAPLSFPARWPMFALDRIWINPSSLLLKTVAHKTTLARVASDHLPIKALFRLLPERPQGDDEGSPRFAPPGPKSGR